MPVDASRWFGTGTAFESFAGGTSARTDGIETLQAMHERWPFFRSLLANMGHGVGQGRSTHRRADGVPSWDYSLDSVGERSQIQLDPLVVNVDDERGEIASGLDPQEANGLSFHDSAEPSSSTWSTPSGTRGRR